MAVDAPSPIVKAYARLKTLRDNLPPEKETYTPRILVDEFNEALVEMKAAGYDVADLAIPDSKFIENWGGMEVNTAYIKARIGAAILAFEIDHSVEKISIGFNRSK